IRHAVIGYQVKLLAHQSAMEDIQAKLAELLPAVPQANIEITRPRRMRRPAKALLAAANGKAVKSNWPADPAERSAEMKRRQAVARANKKKSAQIRWKKSTPQQRAKWLKAMQAGARKKKRREQADNARRAVEQHRRQLPVVKVEATA